MRMMAPFDFEQQWQEKLARGVSASVGDAAEKIVLQDGEELSDESSRAAVIDWTRCAMQRLEDCADGIACREIMTRCACHYPKSDLQNVRAAFAESGDIDQVLELLLEKFESFLESVLHLDQATILELRERGWGLAGVRDGNRIIATKIPKSAFLKAYLTEPDPEARRALYCHCPRVRNGVGLNQSIPLTYCYCGAGFYRSLWEEILQQPVEVEMLESVLSGGEVCRVAIVLPSAFS